VYFLTGGAGYNSLAVEMKDHIVLVEAPNNEARTLALIAKAKELMANKPIRFVINMHHHWDHAGGIRAAIEEGATIVVHETAKAFFERVATMPHTLDPDRLSRSKKAPKFMTVGGKGLTLTDGSRTIEVHEIAPNQPATDFMLVYLPKEKILSEGDGYNSQLHTGERLISVEMPKAMALYNSIQRLKLDVQTIAPIHGRRTTDMVEFEQSIGKRNSSN
jgi:glyoxylase-like metal-dependent hydrolase (beta-lactamase superfamily II)